MSISTNAILIFGVDLGDEIPPWIWLLTGVKDRRRTDPSDEGSSLLELIEALNKRLLASWWC